MQQTAWLVQRVVLATTLMIGFYVPVLTTVGVLLWIPYAEFTLLKRVDLRLMPGCLALAFALLVSRSRQVNPERSGRIYEDRASWLTAITVETLPRGRDAFLAFAKPMKIPAAGAAGHTAERRTRAWPRGSTTDVRIGGRVSCGIRGDGEGGRQGEAAARRRRRAW